MTIDFEKILNLIDSSIHNIKQLQQTYTRFSQRVQWIGMNKMLHSMFEMQQEHEKQLVKLRQQGNLESLFALSDNPGPDASDFFDKIHFSEDMDFINFLSMVILHQEEYNKLYTLLGSLAINSEVKHLFNRLSDDAKKQKLWALDRYELEILTL